MAWVSAGMRFAARRVLTLVLLVSSAMTYYYFALLLPRAHAVLAAQNRDKGYVYGCDFYPLWLTARGLLCCRRDPYTADTTAKIQTGLYGRALDPNRPGDPPQHYRAFAYPLYSDLVVLPAALVSFRIIQIAGMIVFPVFVVVSAVLWMLALGIRASWSTATMVSLLALSSYPALEGIYALQPGLVVSALLAVSMWALCRKNFLLSGMLLGLASMKPQLSFPLILWLSFWAVGDWSKRKRFLIGVAGTLGVLFLASELVQPGWFAEWIFTVADYRGYTEPPLVSLVLGKTLGIFLQISVALVGLATLRRLRFSDPTSSPFRAALVWLLAATVVLIPSSVAVYDQLLLLPGVLWLVWRHRDFRAVGLPLRILGILGVGTLVWPWLVAASVDLTSWASPILAAGISSAPLRTAASFPFVILALTSFFLFREMRARIA